MDRETALNKIRKLLALGTSPNPAEAEAALAKAQALMDEFELSHAELDEAALEWTEEEVFECRDYPMEVRHVNQVVMRLCTVEIIFSGPPGFINKYAKLAREAGAPLKIRRKIIIFGSPERVAFAKYAWVFLLREFRRLWKAHQIATEAAGSAKRSFYVGLEYGFIQRLTREQAARSERYGQENALRLLREKDRVANALAARKPDLGTAKHRDSKISDRDSFRAGVRAGENIEIRKPLAAPAEQLLIGQQ